MEEISDDYINAWVIKNERLRVRRIINDIEVIAVNRDVDTKQIYQIIISHDGDRPIAPEFYNLPWSVEVCYFVKTSRDEYPDAQLINADIIKTVLEHISDYSLVKLEDIHTELLKSKESKWILVMGNWNNNFKFYY